MESHGLPGQIEVTAQTYDLPGSFDAAYGRMLLSMALTTPELGPARAAAEVRDGTLLIDTRCEELRQSDGVIPGSVHVPLSVLYGRLDPASGHDDPRLLDPDRRVILVCARGYSSSIAAATLRQLGFTRATDVIGGVERWRQDGLSVEAAPALR